MLLGAARRLKHHSIALGFGAWQEHWLGLGLRLGLRLGLGLGLGLALGLGAT